MCPTRCWEKYLYPSCLKKSLCFSGYYYYSIFCSLTHSGMLSPTKEKGSGFGSKQLHKIQNMLHHRPRTGSFGHKDKEKDKTDKVNKCEYKLHFLLSFYPTLSPIHWCVFNIYEFSESRLNKYMYKPTCQHLCMNDMVCWKESMYKMRPIYR